MNLNYEYINEPARIQDVVSWLADRRYFGFDSETTSLSPFTGDIVTLQIGNEEKQWIIDKRTVSLLPLRPFFEDPKILKVGQNVKFDLKFLMWLYKWMNIRNVGDTMIAEQVIRCGTHAPANMEALALRYLGIQINKDESLRRSFGNPELRELSTQQLEYAAGDVVHPLRIAKCQKDLIRERSLTATLMLEHQVLPSIARMELAGMGVDRMAWNKLYQKAIVKGIELETKLNKMFGVESLQQTSLFGDHTNVGAIDYFSPKQIKAALKRKGYELENTKKDTLALGAIMGTLPLDLVQSILSYRRYAKRSSTYGSAFLDAIEKATGRIHSDFNQCFTTSGRLSSGEDEDSESDKVNLQNIPREKEYRKCFVPREGYAYIIYDCQALEPRILGELSSDPTYLHAFDNDLDIYGEVGSKMLGEEVSKREGRPAELRDKTKITVLGNSYGTGKEKFHRKMLIDSNYSNGVLNETIKYITREESDMLWEAFFKTCPKIKDCLNDLSAIADPIKSKRRVYDSLADAEVAEIVREKVEKNFGKYQRLSSKDIQRIVNNRGNLTYSETLGGRKRYYKVYHGNYWTESRNQPIQGLGADILKTAMVDIDDHIFSRSYDARIINQVHDEIIVEVKKEQAEQLSPEVKDKFEAAEAKFLKRVPPKVEGGIKYAWEK